MTWCNVRKWKLYQIDPLFAKKKHRGSKQGRVFFVIPIMVYYQGLVSTEMLCFSHDQALVNVKMYVFHINKHLLM